VSAARIDLNAIAPQRWKNGALIVVRLCHDRRP